MTTGQPIRLPSDRNKYNNEFNEALQLQIDLNQTNLEVNRLYKQTGQLPASTQMMDTRSNEEKLMDVEYLKQQIISDLRPIAEPMFASAVVQGVINSPLNVNNSLFRYLAQNAQNFAQTLSKKYRFGIAGDANDVAIMVQFLEDAYVKTKNSFQSIKGYINSNTNEGNRSRSSLLSANDTDNIIAELTDIQKRCDIYIRDLNAEGQGLLTPVLRDIFRKANNILRFLPNSSQMENILNDMKMQGVVGALPNIIYNVFDILKQLPKLSAVQTLLDNIDRGVKTRTISLVQGASRGLDMLFEAFDAAGPNGQILIAFRNQYINAERLQNRRSMIKETEDIRRETAEVARESKAQRVYVVNPGNDPANVMINTPDINGPAIDPGMAPVAGPAVQAGVLIPPVAPAGGVAPANAIAYQNYINANLTAATPMPLLQNLATHINVNQGVYQGVNSNNPLGQAVYNQHLQAVLDHVNGVAILPRLQLYNNLSEVFNDTGLMNIGYDPVNNPATRINVAGLGLGKKVKKGRGLYSPFGDSEINHKNLENNILTLRRKSKTNYMDLPSKHISKHMKNIIHNIVGGKIANFEDMNNLNDEERNYLNKVVKKSNLQDRLSVPAPSKDQSEKDSHQWEVMRGEIMAGNDSQELVKKFKILTMKLTRQGLLPKNEVMDLFEDLVNLGY